MLALTLCLWYILAFTVRLYGPLRRLLLALIDASKRILLTSIEITRIQSSAYSMGGQDRVNRLFKDLQTTISMGTPNNIAAIQGSLIEAIARERLFPTDIIVHPSEVELSESSIISQTPEADVFQGTVGGIRSHFTRYRTHQSQSPDRYDALFKAMANDTVVSLGRRHPNIVLFGGVHRLSFPDIDRLYLIRPPYDSLAQHLSARPHANRRSLAANVAKGLAFLHDLGIVHGALTDSVILVDNSGVARLSDFSQAYTEGAQFTPNIYLDSMACSAKNIVWKAPELLEGFMNSAPVAPTKATDSYALGYIAYTVFTDRYPFRELMNGSAPRAIARVMSAILSGERPARRADGEAVFLERGLTEGIWSTIELCWSRDPHSRPDARAMGRILTLDNVADDGQSESE